MPKGVYFRKNKRPCSEETKIKISEANKDHPKTFFKHTEESKRKISIANKGKKRSQEVIERNRLTHLGKKLTDETKAKLSEIRKGKKLGPMLSLRGENHYKWNGDKTSYIHKHSWAKRMKENPKECSVCGKSNCVIHMANKDHKYSRNVDDYIPMCPKCHCNYDKIHNPIRFIRKLTN